MNPGDRWAAALMYVRVYRVGKVGVSYTLRTGSRARVRRAQDTPDFGGQNP